jgi:8-oxo-dGTP diphosphatase
MAPVAYCPVCGSRTESVFRGGRERDVCPRCDRVLWRNPKAAVAVILRDDRGRVLLVRRTSEPAGSWCIPCGNIEWDEDVREAARREMEEETGYRVEPGPVFTVLSNFHDPEAHSVGIWFLGRIEGGTERPGGDSDETGWFALDRLPEPMAFPTDLEVLAALARGESRH